MRERVPEKRLKRGGWGKREKKQVRMAVMLAPARPDYLREWGDSVVVQNIEVHDTLRERTTITVDRNDKGDTLRQSIVTDRERVRNAADVRSKTVDVRVVRDTVYIEKRDSTSVSSSLQSKATESSAPNIG